MIHNLKQKINSLVVFFVSVFLKLKLFALNNKVLSSVLLFLVISHFYSYFINRDKGYKYIIGAKVMKIEKNGSVLIELRERNTDGTRKTKVFYLYNLNIPLPISKEKIKKRELFELTMRQILSNNEYIDIKEIYVDFFRNHYAVLYQKDKNLNDLIIERLDNF